MTSAASIPPWRARCSVPTEMPSSSATHATSRSPRNLVPEAASEAMANIAAAQPPLSSAAPSPYMRPPSTRGRSASSGQPSYPTVSLCAFKHSVGPPPVPRSRARTFGRPGSTSTISTSAAVRSSQSAMNAATLASPDPVGISQGVTDSIRTSAPSNSTTCLAVTGIGAAPYPSAAPRADTAYRVCSSMARPTMGVKHAKWLGSNLAGEQVVERLTPHTDPGSSARTEDHRWPQRRVVIVGHGKAVGASYRNNDQVPDSRISERDVRRDDVAGFAMPADQIRDDRLSVPPADDQRREPLPVQRML